MACLVDEEKKQVTSLIMDLKKNIMNYDDDLLVNDSLNKALNGVSDFACQLKDEKLHKDSLCSITRMKAIQKQNHLELLSHCLQ